MKDEKQFAVVHLAELIWPKSIRIPTKRFRLFVVADTSELSVEAISNFAEAALRAGMVCLNAWGEGSERFHDIVDECIVGIEVFAEAQNEFTKSVYKVLTAWHSDQSLEEALEFYATWATPSDCFLEDSKFWLVVTVGNQEWAAEAKRILKTVS